MNKLKELEKKIEKQDKLQEEIKNLQKELEKPEFKVNDWVINKPNDGICQITADNNNLWIIHILDVRPTNGNINSDTVFELSKTETKKRFLHAACDEIYEHLLKKAKKDGFDVGFKVKRGTNIYCIEKFELITSANTESTSTGEYYEKHGIHLAIKENPYVFPLNEVELVKDELTFGGEKVEIKYSGINQLSMANRIKCAGEESTMENVLKLGELIQGLKEWKFGSCGNIKELGLDSDYIKIGNLTGKISEIDNIIKHLKS